MKLKNVSARLIGLNGKLYAPLQEFELSSPLEIASAQSWIDSGEFELVQEAAQVEEKAKRGRKPAQEADE